DVGGERRIRIAAPAERNARIGFERLPGKEAGADLFRKQSRIASGIEDFASHLAGDLVISVAVGRTADEHGRDYERPSHAHDANYIGEHTLARPMSERFLLCFGESVIDEPREELIDSVVTASFEQLHRSHKTETIEVI